MLDVQLIQTNPHCISLKIFEDLIRYDFMITDCRIEYMVCKSDGEPVAMSSAMGNDLESSSHSISSI